MASEDRPTLRCFVALPHAREFRPLQRAVERGITRAGFLPVNVDNQQSTSLSLEETVAGEVARADCMIADVSAQNPNIFFELGLAKAMGKPCFLLEQVDVDRTVRYLAKGESLVLPYERTQPGLSTLRNRVYKVLSEYRRSPRRAASVQGRRVATPFFVDWDRLERADAENLCRELLSQMGYVQVDWHKGSEEFDLVAQLPRKDPDGFEYRELWIIAMGRHAPAEMVLNMATEAPDFFVHRVLQVDERLRRMLSGSDSFIPLTLLVILLGGERLPDDILERIRHSDRRERSPGSVRVRVWDRDYLTSLVHQFPQIGFKYFSDEGRAQSKFRKTPEELYEENVKLTERLRKVITDLEEEKNRRVRAERDAVWKDISFSAAHKMGNPIFAIETDLDPLRRRILDGRVDEARQVIDNICASIEKAKAIVDQFKSLTLAQQVTPVNMLLRALIEDACRTAETQGIKCSITCASDLSIRADPSRLGECLDELVANAMHWVDKRDGAIVVDVSHPGDASLPTSVDSSQTYILVRFKDNGPGVQLKNKYRIFDAFFTSYSHGAGLGLALVRRVIEAHGGTIREIGIPGKGAEFEIYLPVGTQEDSSPKLSTQPKRRKRKVKR